MFFTVKVVLRLWSLQLQSSGFILDFGGKAFKEFTGMQNLL